VGDVEQIEITRRSADTHQDAQADSASHFAGGALHSGNIFWKN
jgi:hypothetical protein